MKVFVSWSGTASRELALALAAWIPKVIQGVVPFVSSKDIDKGANWTVALANELADSDFGIVCLTPDNLLSPWLNYEAGAITTSVRSRVCPVLLGVAKGDVKAPLSQLQMTSIDVDDFILLMNSVNKAAGSQLETSIVEEAVRVWWSWLEAKVQAIDVPAVENAAKTSPEPPKPESSTQEMLEEILGRLRRIESAQRRDSSTASRSQPRVGSRHAASERIDRVVEIATAAGLVPQRGNSTDEGYRLTVSLLPSPLPTAAYDGFGAWAKEYGQELIVTNDADREVIFDKSGQASEPPF